MDNFLALDIGEKRIGVAVAHSVARLPRPLPALLRDDNLIEAIRSLVRQEEIGTLVVGLPRGMQSQETAQTQTTQAFIEELKAGLDIAVVTQDEALTSHQAEAELNRRGRAYDKGEVDSLAAVYILEDYLREVPQRTNHEENPG